MKKYLLLLAIFCCSIQLMAQAKSDTLFVRGNCEHCQERIEGIASAVQGVSSVSWQPELNRLIIVYADGAKSMKSEIATQLAAAGHDTKLYRAKDEVYQSLPGCCKYEREDPKLAEKNLTQLEFNIEGMTCEDGCAKGIEANIYKIKGVKFSEVDFERKRAKVIYDPRKVSKADIVKAVVEFKSAKDENNSYLVVFLYE